MARFRKDKPASGQVSAKTGSTTHKSTGKASRSNAKSSDEILNDSVLALGGTQEDLAFIKDVDDTGMVDTSNVFEDVNSPHLTCPTPFDAHRGSISPHYRRTYPNTSNS